MIEGRPWAIIENVVVAREQRGKGFGKKLINFAEEKGCYKLQLLSGPTPARIDLPEHLPIGGHMKEAERALETWDISPVQIFCQLRQQWRPCHSHCRTSKNKRV